MRKEIGKSYNGLAKNLLVVTILDPRVKPEDDE